MSNGGTRILLTGHGWELKDKNGTFKTVINATEEIDRIEYYRVDWIDDILGNYQSEYWFNQEDGVYAAGRKFGDTVIMFKNPYLLLKHKLSVGDSWKSEIKMGNISKTIVSKVEKAETIDTEIGDLEAFKIVLTGKGLRMVRWYSKGIGIVKESSYSNIGDGFKLLNDKTIVKVIQPD